ncbi:hypothetical protein [Paraflavitalea pollutisoli]|uniref:hypothetical protein n=1 Tax=Paraflavitalea pollutisoli TaxID=3034143 RepID=UPI0023ECE231|nr:hypothetical protein [Paraflavitalea sp. H1-2-19X]
MKCVFFIPVLFCWAVSWGQKTWTIQVDKAGKIGPVLPERLGRTDNIQLNLNDPEESFDKYKNAYVNQLKRAESLIAEMRKDADKMKVLSTLFGISNGDINLVVNEIKQAIANPLSGASFNYIPSFSAAQQKYYKVVLKNTASIINDAFGPNQTGNALLVTPKGSESRIGFEIRKTDAYRKLVFEWFTKTNGLYAQLIDASVLPKFQQEIKSLVPRVELFADSCKKIIADLLKERKAGLHDDKLLIKYKVLLETIISRGAELNKEIDQMLALYVPKVVATSNKDWVLKWLWYQTTVMPATNPFGFGEGLAKRPDTSALGSLRIKLQTRESFLKSNLDRLKDKQLDSLLDVIESYKKQLQSIEQTVAAYVQQEKVSNTNKEVFCTTTFALNNGVLFVDGTDNNYYWMRHHDAATNYEIINDRLTDEYLETDPVIILAHNLQPNQKASLNLTFKEIENDQSLLSDILIPQIKALKASQTGTGSGAAVRVDQLLAASDSVIDELTNRLQDIRIYNKAIDYLMGQSNPPLQLEEQTDKSKAYHSEVTNPVKKVKGPRKATYYLNTVVLNAQGGDSLKLDKVPTDTFSYRINKLYRLFPMAGIAWVPQRLASVNRDSAGNFSIDQEATVKFVVGLKVYLRKTDIRSPQFITGKDRDGKPLLLSRTSITVAFDVKKPMDNIYTGVGFDLWPGFCFNVGGMFNKYHYKSYKDGKVFQDKKPYRAAFFMGLSTDLTLFAELGKFLNF